MPNAAEWQTWMPNILYNPGPNSPPQVISQGLIGPLVMLGYVSM
jgi:hypothetical protein